MQVTAGAVIALASDTRSSMDSGLIGSELGLSQSHCVLPRAGGGRRGQIAAPCGQRARVRRARSGLTGQAVPLRAAARRWRPAR